MPKNNIEAKSISTADAVGLVQMRYPDLAVLPANLRMDDSLLARCQLVLRFREPKDGKEIEFIARYNQVEFRRPYSEAFLETKTPSRVQCEINELADKGYVIVHQELTLGITGDIPVRPSKRA